MCIYRSMSHHSIVSSPLQSTILYRRAVLQRYRQQANNFQMRNIEVWFFTNPDMRNFKSTVNFQHHIHRNRHISVLYCIFRRLKDWPSKANMDLGIQSRFSNKFQLIHNQGSGGKILQLFVLGSLITTRYVVAVVATVVFLIESQAGWAILKNQNHIKFKIAIISQSEYQSHHFVSRSIGTRNIRLAFVRIGVVAVRPVWAEILQ